MDQEVLVKKRELQFGYIEARLWQFQKLLVEECLDLK